mgnify:CR=1 FL=1
MSQNPYLVQKFLFVVCSYSHLFYLIISKDKVGKPKKVEKTKKVKSALDSIYNQEGDKKEEVIEEGAPEELAAPEATNVKADDDSSDDSKDDKKVDSKEEK